MTQTARREMHRPACAIETAFPMYSQNDGSLRVEYAHNDYLQVLSDGGVVGGVLSAWFLVALGRAFLRAMRSMNQRVRAVALGSGAGVFAILVHSLFDFNLQIPSNALLFLLLAAVIWSASAEEAASPVG